MTARQDLGFPSSAAFSPTTTTKFFFRKKTQPESSVFDTDIGYTSHRVSFSSSRTLADGQHVFAVRVDAVVVVRT